MSFLKSIPINGRYCWVTDVKTPTTCIVLLHAMTITAFDMAICVKYQEFANKNILVVFPSSETLTNWNYSIGSNDFKYLDSLKAELKINYPSLQAIHLGGFSNGGFMSSALFLYGNTTWDSYWQVASTIAKTEDTPQDQVSKNVNLFLGQQDPIVPYNGNSQFLSGPDSIKIFQEAGAIVNSTIYQGGHCWPGGNPPPEITQWIMGPWVMTPDVTELIIQNIIIQ